MNLLSRERVSPGDDCLLTLLSLSDIDECQNGPVCQQNAACLNLPGSYRCECKPGYRFTPTGQCLGKDVVLIRYGPQRDKRCQQQSDYMEHYWCCDCSLDQQQLSQLLMTSVEIKISRNRIREKIRWGSLKSTVLHADGANFSESVRGLMLSYLLKLLYQTQLHETLWTALIYAKDKAPAAAQRQSSWGHILHGGLVISFQLWKKKMFRLQWGKYETVAGDN